MVNWNGHSESFTTDVRPLTQMDSYGFDDDCLQRTGTKNTEIYLFYPSNNKINKTKQKYAWNSLCPFSRSTCDKYKQLIEC